MEEEQSEPIEIIYTKKPYFQIIDVMCSVTKRYMGAKFIHSEKPRKGISHSLTAIGMHEKFAQTQEDPTQPSELEELTGTRFISQKIESNTETQI